MNGEDAAPLDLGFLDALGPDGLRSVLPRFLAGFLASPEAAARNEARVAELVAGWDDPTCLRLLDRLRALGEVGRVYRADPDGRRLSREWSRDVVLAPEVEGAGHLAEAVAAGPTALLCNHLSYFDTTATDAVLAWTGHADLADRLMAAAGPKVYQDLFRVVAAACLNTLPVPQSTSFSHTEKLSPRELARRVGASVESAGAAMSEGLVLLLYPEGSRTRTGRMGPFLKGVHRYLGAVDGLRVVPAAIVGTDRVMPVASSRLHPAPVRLAFGAPLRVGPDGGPKEILEQAHARVAALLPEALRPPPDAPATA